MTKTAAITGAAGAIGRALVERFVRDGLNVIALDKTRAVFADPAVRFIELDLGMAVVDTEYRERVFREIFSILPASGLDVLVNNAATQVAAPVESISLDAWRQTMNVNVTAPFVLIQAFLSALKTARGCVINIASIHAQLTKPGFVAYATSKAALVGLTRSLAVELGSDVRVNAIAPAAIDTPMLRAGFANAAAFSSLKSFHPVNEIGTPQQVADLAGMIADSKLQFLNGSVIQLDGGIGARLHDPV